MRPERAEFERKKKNVTFTEAQTYTRHSTEVKRVTDYEEKKKEDQTLTRSNQQGEKKKRETSKQKKKLTRSNGNQKVNKQKRRGRKLSLVIEKKNKRNTIVRVNRGHSKAIKKRALLINVSHCHRYFFFFLSSPFSFART